MPHICVGEPPSTNSQMRALGTIFNEIRMEIKYISFTKVHSKISFAAILSRGRWVLNYTSKYKQQYVIWRNGAGIISNIASQIWSK